MLQRANERTSLLPMKKRKHEQTWVKLIVWCLSISMVLMITWFSLNAFQRVRLPDAESIIRDIWVEGATYAVSPMPILCTPEIRDVLYIVTDSCGRDVEFMFKTMLSGSCGRTLNVQCPTQCPEPSTCSPPEAKFKYEAPIHHARLEWPNQAGYCGAVSITIIAQSFGIWLSQHFIRMHTPKNSIAYLKLGWGVEINHLNIEGALRNLKLDTAAWDWQATSSTEEYLKFLHHHLVNKHPLVWFVILNGDPNWVVDNVNYVHIEPVFGIYTNHSNDEYHADDVIVHASDWDGFHYYRTMKSLPDTVAMNGNCKNTPDLAGYNEAYPCIDDDGPNFGYAIKGIIDPAGNTIRISLDVHHSFEPNVVTGQAPILFENPTVYAEEPLEIGRHYYLYRYDNDVSKIPTDSDFEHSNWDSRHEFVAKSTQWSYSDPKPIRSDSGTYYILVPQDVNN